MDGEIDQIWHAQDPFTIAVLQNGTIENGADFSAEWYGLWDDTYFYFLIDVTDQFLESEAGADIWRNDRIEVYFNMDNVKPGGNGHNGDNYQYAFHWNKPDEEFVSNSTWDGIEWGQMTTDYGYVVEVKIPWTTLTTQFTAEEDWSFGFDIAINDNDGSSVYDSVTYWWNSLRQSEWGNIDGAGTVGLSTPFDGNYKPQIADLDTQIALEGTPSDFMVTATDANQDSIVFSADDLPSFVQLQDNSNGTATLSVNAQPGDANIYNFDLTASDGAKSDTIEVTLIVKDPNVPTQSPVVGNPGDITVDQDNRRIVEISVTDLDSVSVLIEGTTLPDFATLTDNEDKTATIVFSPTSSTTTQSYSVTVAASDADENTDSVTFNVTVRAPQELGTYYCDPDSGDLNNIGSAGSPWSSLDALLDSGRRFAPGDTIYLLSGHHGSPLFTGANSGAVYVTADEGAAPTFASLTFASVSAYWHVSGAQISPEFEPAARTGTMVSISGQHNTVSDCQIFTASSVDGWTQQNWLSRPTSGVTIGNSNNVIEYCTIRNVRMGITIGGTFNVARSNRIQNFTVDGIRGLGDDLLVEYNYISDNYNIDDNHDDGFQSFTGGSGEYHRVVLRGNTIVETTDPNRPFQGSLQGIGCFDGMFIDWVVENNVIIVNQWHGIAFLGARGCKVVNNTVVDQDMNRAPGPTWITITAHKNYSTSLPQEEQEYYLGGDNLVRNNLTTRMQVSSTFGTVDNNKTLAAADFDNYFVDYPFDLRLKFGSPAIDAGTNDQAATVDALGNPRPFDGNEDSNPVADWGAFEFSLWRTYEMRGGWAFTGDNYFGWLYVVHNRWQYCSAVSEWIYSDIDYFTHRGSWAYFPGYGGTNVGWFLSAELNTWVYKNSASTGSWIYVLNTGN